MQRLRKLEGGGFALCVVPGSHAVKIDLLGMAVLLAPVSLGRVAIHVVPLPYRVWWRFFLHTPRVFNNDDAL